jgi:hypothetical protein
MKVLFRNIFIGIFTFVLFAQINFKHDNLVGDYLVAFDYISSKLKLKSKFKFEKRIKTCTSIISYKGNWSVDNENVILVYKNKYNIKPDTLKIKRLDSKIDSLGVYKKLITYD